MVHFLQPITLTLKNGDSNEHQMLEKTSQYDAATD